ncbi:MAG TPA: nucleotide exchange factor GrpE [Geminicoccaceae bacterium]|nr:nucleotide exchange factor GrpE [Geminicoccus sp.]HMU52258.1 nucleotide exchange factor GrpE [Geminicoccaceae bacterium]
MTTNEHEKNEMIEDDKLASDQTEPVVAEPTPAEAEIAELKDRLLRTLADMENLRQRTRREVEEAQTFAVTRFARDLLEVADNLRRAVESAPKGAASEPVRNLVAGVEMTEQSLLSVLERHKVRKVVPARGERFDHKLHQAMFELPTAELPPGTVAEVMAPGYVIGDRLLRAAMVGVAKALPGAESESRGATVDTTA